MRISNRIVINAPPERVFYWLEDPNRAMEWMTSVSKSETLKQTPDMVGTTFRELIVDEKGRGTEMRGVVTAFTSNKRLAFHLEGRFNTVGVEFIIEERGKTTQLTQSAEIHFKGPWRILSIILQPFLKRKVLDQSKKEFLKLKTLCEEATHK